VRAERRAWLILWVAFATFCAVVFAAIKFAVDYVSTAEVDQGARVTASRGPVIVNLPGSADMTLLGARSELGVGTIVGLDRASVATVDLQFFDDSRINVLGGASIELTRMEVGRFINQHSLVLTQTTGPIRYATGGPMDVQVPNGLVQLASHGDYTVWIDGEVTRVLVYGGEARVSARGATVTVGEGRRALIDGQGLVQPAVDRPESLLANSAFALHDQNWEPLDVVNTRDPVPPDERSLAIGKDVYTTNCETCHGETGRGDGPTGLRLVPRPADLRLHTAPGVHTDGELFYWVSYGFPNSAMPAWKDLLTEEQRWSAINYARATFGNSGATAAPVPGAGGAIASANSSP